MMQTKQSRLPQRAGRLVCGTALVLICVSMPSFAQQNLSESRSHVRLAPPGAAGKNNVLLQYQMLQQLQQMSQNANGASPQQLDSLLDGLEPEDIQDLAKWAQANLNPDLTGSDLSKLTIPPKLAEKIDSPEFAEQLRKFQAGRQTNNEETQNSQADSASQQRYPLGYNPSESRSRQPNSGSSTPRERSSSQQLPTNTRQPAASNPLAGTPPSGSTVPPRSSNGLTRNPSPRDDRSADPSTNQPAIPDQQAYTNQDPSANRSTPRTSAPTGPTLRRRSTEPELRTPPRSNQSEQTSTPQSTTRLPSSRLPTSRPPTSRPPTSRPPTSRPPTSQPLGNSPTSTPSASEARQYFQELAQRNPEAAQRLVEQLAGRSQMSSPDADLKANRTQGPLPGNPLRKSAEDIRSQDDSSGSGLGSNTSVQEIIRDMVASQSELPPLEEIAKLTGQSGSGNGGLSGPLAEQLKSMVDRDLTKKLESNGITRTLRGLFDEARKAPPPSPPEATTGAEDSKSLSSSVERSVLSTLDGLGKSLLGKNDDKPKTSSASSTAATSTKKSTPGLANNTGTGSSQRKNSQPSTGLASNAGSANKSKEPGFLSSASKAIDRWVASGRDKQQSTQSSGSPSSGPLPSAGLPDVAPGLSWVFYLALAAIAAAAALFFLRKRIPGLATLDAGLPFPVAAMAKIRTHADIIKAFHALAFRTPGQTESWWTHRRAAAELSPADATLQSAWNRLAKLYEEARYHHDRQELSSEKALAAEQALQTLAQASPNA